MALLSLVLIVILLVWAIVLKLNAIEQQRLAEVKMNRPPVNVVVQRLVPTPINDRLTLPAVVEPWDEIVLKAEVFGPVTHVSVKEGDNVRVGGIIARIDPRDYENAFNAAQASSRLARKALKRTQSLHDRGIASSSALDTAQAEADRTEAQMKSAALALERTVIRSPLNGVVNRLYAKKGLLLSVNDEVAEVMDMDPVKVSAGIPESDVTDVRGLDSFGVEVDALDSKFVGKKHFLSKRPDDNARAYRLEVVVPNADALLLPGMFARVDIVKRTAASAISVPVYAVISQRDKRLVYVVEDGVARSREVTTGILEGWRIEITSGLMPDDRVIIVGHRSVGDGQEVNVIAEVTDPAELIK